MCGIYGLWQRDGRPLALAAVQRATATLRHRGPDDEGYLLVNTSAAQTVSCAGQDTAPALGLLPLAAFAGQPFDLAFGFRRLAILDLSPAGHQPMASADGRLWLVFNGEIYNYQELRAELAGYGHAFHTGTDTEVVLAAYAQWGADCLARFNGMWAFALWDGRERSIFLSRDRFGVKPLYYVEQKGAFAFASEIKALVGPHGIPFAPAEREVYRYLAAGLLPSPRGGQTFFAGVRSLPAGQWLKVGVHGHEQQRYWLLTIPSAAARPASATQAIQDYRDLFVDAVRLRLRADVPIGTCLSGGVDSSSIVCTVNGLMASDGLSTAQIGQRQRTFSAVYETEAPYNEHKYVQRVLEATGAAGAFVCPSLPRLRQDVERLVWCQEEPFQSSSIFAQWCVMSIVREHGVTVLLDGQGADETLAGYRPFVLHLADTLGRGFGPALAEAQAIRATAGLPPLLLLARALAHKLPAGWRGRLRQQPLAADRSPLNPAFAQAWRAELSANPDPALVYDTLADDLQHQVEETSLPNLLRYEDRNSMAFGVEARVPFLDYRLVQFSFGEGAPWRIHAGWTKWVLRKAMEGTVPATIVWRKDKVGFETPEADWLRRWLSEEADLFAPLARSRSYLNLDRVRQRIAAWMANEGDASPVWRWLNLELWLRVWQARTTPDRMDT